MKNDQRGVGHVAMVLAALMVLAFGFTVWRVIDSDDSGSQASSSENDSSDTVEQLPSDLSEIRPVSEIQEIAQAASDRQISGIELEVEDGETIYVVRFSDGSIVAYSALSGEVVEYSDDDEGKEEDDDDTLPANFAAGISLQEAIDIASAERPDSDLEKVELEVEDGVVVYSVRFTDDSRVDVNAEDGTIQRLRDEEGEDLIKVDDDFDDDGIDNPEDDDDDNDGIKDEDDSDDDNDGIEDEDDDDDDNDGMDDDEDDDDDEADEDEEDNDDDSSSN